MKNSFQKKTVLFSVLMFAFLGQVFCQNQGTSQNQNDSSQTSNSVEFNLTQDPSEIQLNFDENSNQVSNNNENRPSLIISLLKMIFVLVLVVACIYGVFWLFKKSVRKTENDDPFLRNVSSLTFGPGKSIQIVTLQENAFVVGVTDQNINLIGKIEDKELVNAMNLYADKKENVSKPKTFSEILDIFTGFSNKKNEKESFEKDISEDAVELIKEQNKRLDGEL